MRYGNPSIPAVLRELRAAQPGAAAGGAALSPVRRVDHRLGFDAIARELAGWRNLPELRMVRGFHREPGYIAALAAQVRRQWEAEGRATGW